MGARAMLSFGAVLLLAGSAEAWAAERPSLAGRYWSTPGHGATAFSEPPPLRDEYARTYAARLESRRVGRPIGDPTAGCAGGGFPRVLNVPYPTEILETPDQMLWLWEGGDRVRRVYRPGRKGLETLPPLYSGVAVGQWEGEVFVIRSERFVDWTILDPTGVPHSAQMRTTERISVAANGDLVDEVTIDDPVAFTRPWTLRFNLRKDPTIRMMEYSCEENNRNKPNAQGETTSK
ncbi:hypothetical protein [Phenylobacterium sp.]|uniref:hypothetical protein n=1 Tax=Phenylobacterium sp. TaxID=1871053 RepID=UPI0035AFE68D